MPAAPTGEVTLVFTDVQGSTALWDRAPEAMREALALHDALMRQTLADEHGYEVKTEGDAFMVAFHSPTEAVSWCLTVQQALLDARWPPTITEHQEAKEQRDEQGKLLFAGLRVRMGAHTGQPICQPDPNTGRMDYFGGMVNRAARVGGAGHGGQIIISASTWEQLSGRVGDAVVDDLGEHALKGLKRHEHLRQVLPSALAGRQFQRLKTPSLKNTNLGKETDKFFGRKQELDELAQRVFKGERLITLLGPGGTGKTRLAQHFSSEMTDEFPGGVWFCDLSEARTKAGIVAAIASALQVPLTQLDPAEQIAHAICGRDRVLLVLDNFEQVIEHAAQSLGHWLQAAPEAMFVVTSRTLLRIAGEHAVHLEPLPIADGVSLFFDRAKLVEPTFARTPDAEILVEQIVTQLDGLSLAIELAAARSSMMTPKTLLERLDQRFRLLKGQRRDLPGRQSTMRAAIDWSWNLLDSSERSALAQLSVFRGGCSLEAAEAVIDLSGVDDDAWTTDVVSQLVDHSLLRRSEPLPGHVRFDMLETIRMYAAEKLGENQAAAQARHAAYYAQLGGFDVLINLMNNVGTTHFKSIELERDNLMAGAAANDDYSAVSCALASARLFEVSGPLGTAESILRTALRRPGSDTTRSLVLFQLGHLLTLRHGGDEAQNLLEKALKLTPTNRDGLLACYVHLNLGVNASNHNRLSTALTHFNQSLGMARALGDPTCEGIALANLGNLHTRTGRLDQAASSYALAKARFETTNDERRLCSLWMALASRDSDKGEFEQAVAKYQIALRIAEKTGSLVTQAKVLANLAGTCMIQSNYRTAMKHNERALSIAQKLGDPATESIVLGHLGELHWLIADEAQAVPLLEQAIAGLDRVNHPASGAFRGQLASIKAAQDNHDQAAKLISKAKSQLAAIPLAYAKLLCQNCEVESAAGHNKLAQESLHEAQRIAEELKVLPHSELGQSLELAEAVIKTQQGTS